MKQDLTASFDRVAQRWRRRFLRERDLPNVMGPHYLRRVFALLQPALVFDVGANAGQYADLLRQEVGYQGPICSVEPIPAVAQALKDRTSGDAQWSVYPLALGREAGRAQFNIMAGSEFSSFKAPDAAFEGRFHGQHRIEQVVDVEVETLDGLARRIGRVSQGRDIFLKLDTQGTELDVLAGAAAVLPHVSAIQTEISLKPIYAGAPSADTLLAHVQGLGFELAALFPNNEGHFPRLLELDAIFIHGSLLPELS